MEACATLRVQGPWRAFGGDLLTAEGCLVDSATWHLFGGSNPDVQEHEEELFVCRSSVIWSSGRALRKRYTTAPVVQAVRCCFPDSAETSLCLLHADSLTTWAPTGETHTVQLQVPLSPTELGTGHHPGLLWPTPLGLVLQRFTGGPHGVQLHALLNPVDSTTRVDLPGVTLHWSSPTLPLVVGCSSDTVQLLRVEDAPLDPGLPVGVQSRRLACTCLWDGVLEEVTSVCAAHDRDGTLLVVILDAVTKRLVALRVESDTHGVPTSVAEAFRLDATAAAPLAATRHVSGLGSSLLDLLVLRPSGRLELFVGQEHVCTCDFPQLPAAATPDAQAPTTGGSIGMDMALTPVAKTRSVADQRTPRTAASDAMDMDMELTPLSSAPAPPAATPATVRQAAPVTPPPSHVAPVQLMTTDIVGLVDACGPRVNALMADGSRHRLSLPLAPLSPLVGAVLAALRHELPQASWNTLERKYYQSPEATGDSPDDAWHALSSLILRMSGVPASLAGQPAPVDGAAPWEGLLASGLHERCAPGLPGIMASVVRGAHVGGAGMWPRGPGGPAAAAGALVLDALHALYEDCKLDCMRHTHLLPLAQLATRLASWTGDAAHVEHYQRDWGAPSVGTRVPHGPAPPARQPPDTLRALHALLATGSTAAMDALLPRALQLATGPGAGRAPPHVAWSAAVCRAFRALSTRGPVGVPPACVDGGLDSRALARLPVGVALVLQEALAHVRSSPPDGWPPAAYILIGRPDCASAATGSHGGEAPRQAGPQSQLPTLLRALSLDTHAAADSGLDAAGGVARDGGDGGGGNGAAAIDDADAVPDGMDDLAGVVGPLRFGRDARVLDVRHLLCSAKPVPLTHGDGSGEGGEPDAALGGSQPRLWALAARTCALPLGRGAFTLGTWHPLPASTLPVPPLCLAGRLMASHNATIQLSLTSPGAPPNFTCWPEFHNGCAAGLRFAGGDVTPPLTRSWILHGRPKENSNQQAGVLLALGLAGHLTALGQAEQFGYLEGEHSPTTCALLLGLAASSAGSSHGPTSRTLFLHLPSKHPASFPELELPHTVQAAALVGIGLLYRGTAHRAMVDALLSELRRASAGPEVASDGREGHALAAGLALGTVLLGHGRGGSAHIADLCVDAHLVSLMRYDASVAAAAAAAATSGTAGEGSGIAGGTSTDALAILPVLRSLNGDMAVPNPYARGGGLFLPGAGVNLGVTGPGAALALGLWFLRTGDLSVASQFQVPASPAALDDVRPEQLLLRIVARAMVLWDGVHGSPAWVDAQLPPFLASALETQPGGQQQPGGGDDPQLGGGHRSQDRESMATAAAYIRAGACLALGLRFAGTCDSGAAAELRRHVLLFMELKRVKGGVAIDKHALETCLCCAALGLACVLAGSGHLDTLRLLRLLRRRVDPPHHGGGGGSITYGSHMAISLAIGLLFLGGGTHTLSTSPAATAALLTAIVPPFPATPTDNRGHLQALRHLYVLAAVRRDVRAVDADTRSPCYAPVELQYQDGATHHTCAPCCAPRAQEVTEMRVLGPRHWPLTIRGPHLRSVLRGEAALVVKRRPGCLPYQDDPRGTRSLLSRALAVEDANAGTAYQAGSHLRAACAVGDDQGSDALAACVPGAAEDALPAHVSLHSTVTALHSAAVPRDAPLCVAMHNLRLCSTLYSGPLWATRISSGTHEPPLMQPAFAEACRLRSAAALERHVTEHSLREYVAGRGVPGPMTGALLLLHGVPYRDVALAHGLPAALGAATARPEESLPLPYTLLRGLVNAA